MQEINAVSRMQSKMVDKIIVHRTRIVVLLGAAIVLGIALIGLDHYSDYKAQKAAGALFEANEKLEAVLPTTPTGDLKDATGAMEALEKSADAHKSTTPAFEAYLKLADLRYDRGQYDQAAVLYEKAVGSAKAKTLKVTALIALSYSKENLKDYKGALQELQKAIPIADKSLHLELITAAMRNAKLAGDAVKEKDFRNILIKDYPDSPEAKAITVSSGAGTTTSGTNK